MRLAQLAVGVAILCLVLLCALSSCNAEDMGADMEAAAASSSRQLLQPVLLRHADSSDASEESLWDTIEPHYSDSETQETAMVEETSSQVRSTTGMRCAEGRERESRTSVHACAHSLLSSPAVPSAQHTPRIMRSSQFKEYMKSIVVRGTRTQRDPRRSCSTVVAFPVRR